MAPEGRNCRVVKSMSNEEFSIVGIWMLARKPAF